MQTIEITITALKKLHANTGYVFLCNVATMGGGKGKKKDLNASCRSVASGLKKKLD